MVLRPAKRRICTRVSFCEFLNRFCCTDGSAGTTAAVTFFKRHPTPAPRPLSYQQQQPLQLPQSQQRHQHKHQHKHQRGERANTLTRLRELKIIFLSAGRSNKSVAANLRSFRPPGPVRNSNFNSHSSATQDQPRIPEIMRERRRVPANKPEGGHLFGII